MPHMDVPMPRRPGMAESGGRKYIPVGSGPAFCDVEDIQVSRSTGMCESDRADGLRNKLRNSFG